MFWRGKSWNLYWIYKWGFFGIILNNEIWNMTTRTRIINIKLKASIWSCEVIAFLISNLQYNLIHLTLQVTAKISKFWLFLTNVSWRFLHTLSYNRNVSPAHNSDYVFVIARRLNIREKKKMSRVAATNLTETAKLDDNSLPNPSVKPEEGIRNGRYIPICRLEYGSFSTVWIAEDIR